MTLREAVTALLLVAYVIIPSGLLGALILGASQLFE